jgi:hypothetical protein
MLADIKKIQNYSINTCLTRLNQGKAGISARAISRGTRFLFFSGSEPVLPHLLPERKWSLTPFSKLLTSPRTRGNSSQQKRGDFRLPNPRKYMAVYWFCPYSVN